MIRAILAKEFYQHRILLLTLPPLVTLGYIIFISLNKLSVSGGSLFYNLSWFLWSVFPLFILTLFNALISDEYRQRTQIFLEGLPLPRFVFLLVKYLMGVMVSFLLAAVFLGVTILNSWHEELITWHFFCLLSIRTLLWVWLCCSFLFLLAFLGRYRFAFGIFTVLLLLLLSRLYDTQPGRIGPFQLMGDQFAYERFEIPAVAIGYAMAISVVSTAIGFSFGLARDAALASMLAEKMSFREKIAICGVLLSLMWFSVSVSERQQSIAPLHLPGSVDTVFSRGTVSAAAAMVNPGHEVVEALERHSKSASLLLDEVSDYLDIQSLPTVFFVHREDFKAGRYESGNIDTRQGVLIRFNAVENTPGSEQWKRTIIRSVLLAHQHNRLDSDTRDWVVTGFAAWWAADKDGRSINAELVAAGMLNDNWVEELSESDLAAWRAYRKRVGDQQCELVAGALIAALNAESTPESTREFLCEVLGYSAPHDIRAMIHDYWYSVDSVLASSTKLTFEDICKPVREALKCNRLP